MKGQRGLICRSLPLKDRLRTDLQKPISSNSKRNAQSKSKTVLASVNPGQHRQPFRTGSRALVVEA